jgi:hypothetical protein
MDDLQFIHPYAIVSQLQVATICFPRAKVDIRSMVTIFFDYFSTLIKQSCRIAWRDWP